MNNSLDLSKIPKGCYCYDENGTCPYWELRENRPGQENGYCYYLELGDWEDNWPSLFDQVKECRINDDDEALYC